MNPTDRERLAKAVANNASKPNVDTLFTPAQQARLVATRLAVGAGYYSDSYPDKAQQAALWQAVQGQEGGQ
jgi:hypothetical protein